MITFKQIFRAVQTVAVPLILAYVVRLVWPEQTVEETPASLYRPLLADIDFVPRVLPVTFRADVPELASYERVSVVQNSTGPADTTAVILNWSRFPNVLLITSLLCGPWLDNTIAQVYIWNNHHKPLSYEDLKNTGCPRSKLRIHNAPANKLFQGRYLACAQADTPYCFIQDDDFLIRSEIIQTLRARIAEPGASGAIHLLPPDQHLSTALREVHVRSPDASHLADIHTSFAWLGYGAMLRRSEAQRFLNLMRYLRAADDEMKMADNFFTILSNRVPEVWFDQNFELGGGHAFTVGSEGDERNRDYTLRATRYLESLTHCGHASCDDSTVDKDLPRPRPPYVTLDGPYTPSGQTHAACRGSACVLETNIRLAPETISHFATNVNDILTLERRNSDILGEAGKSNYLEHAPSNAVDLKAETVFRSFAHAAEGDTLALDILTDISDAREWTAVELVWLVGAATEDILQACTFEWSSDSVTWHAAAHNPICYATTREATIGEEKVPLSECSVQMVLGSSALHLRATGRHYRARLGEDKSARWVVAEVWLRGL
ncbi:uncharacterized protein TRAVEDRAFT_157845 [Trametes versicolor FP-101664 SS1]|uniref:uncharacterized protein n=1 Tax=Trametes versicolor (strain FP-101664) TaxID=717944 RepID=UPI0004623802|nr:uncharacterized protein TRAVEDRAFT_157845 [Trametes versicolor FP-101664 SS1]EIW63994.1 hypothetical protein TRAVEDRAFT_157845 [Trametes versicolor FP-101664 SS1]